MCTFDPHYCMLYIPFNKPIIAIFAFRLDGHHLATEQDTKGNSFIINITDSAWLGILQEMERHPQVVLGSTNLYDTMYTNHFTGSLWCSSTHRIQVLEG
jgi:hypothetical protein